MPVFCRYWPILLIACGSVLLGACGCDTPSADLIAEPKSTVGQSTQPEQTPEGGIANNILRSNELEDTTGANFDLPSDTDALMASLAGCCP